MLSDAHAMGVERVSRRAALRRFGRAGLLATVGAGMLELAGASGASAKAQPRAGLAADAVPAVGIITTTGSATPNSCQCTGRLEEGHCTGGPCPSGFYCYEVDYCGSATTKYACINCEGTPTCSYDCS